MRKKMFYRRKPRPILRYCIFIFYKRVQKGLHLRVRSYVLNKVHTICITDIIKVQLPGARYVLTFEFEVYTFARAYLTQNRFDQHPPWRNSDLRRSY